jgi:hypothetical protein
MKNEYSFQSCVFFHNGTDEKEAVCAEPRRAYDDVHR